MSFGRRATDCFWEDPYGFEFAVGMEDSFIPQTSPRRRALDEYKLTGHYDNWREDLKLAVFSLVDWSYPEGDKLASEYLWHMGMYDLRPDEAGGFCRVETPVVRAFQTATG